jgi:hypothetical protein
MAKISLVFLAILVCTFMPSVTFASPVEPLGVYLSAHPDDWQAIMGYHFMQDIQEGNQILIIQYAAGDAGRSIEYWFPREVAELTSVYAAMNDTYQAVNAAHHSLRLYIRSQVTLNGHLISVGTKMSITVLFLRLPDGGAIESNGDIDHEACGGIGQGSERYGCQSLSNLRDQNVPLSAVDGSSTYMSWRDLADTTIAAIIHYAENRNVILNAPSPDRAWNTFDHPDHYAVGDLATTVLETHVWRTRFYLGYTIIDYPRNLSRSGRDLKYQVCRPYDLVFHELTGIWTWSSGEYEWMLWREYYRET